MMKIGTVNKTKEILDKYNLYAVKQFGQNFIVDQNILEGIVKAANIDKNINVIEIGPGIGSLTEHLLDNANKVLAYEIDKKLIAVLEDNFKDYDNFILKNEDVLKADINKDIDTYFDDKDIYVVANLPYYITTPIIMKFLEGNFKIKKYFFMVQKEVADRIVANKGGKDYNNLTISINYRADCKKVLDVSRNIFMPKPNVDSAVVMLSLPKEKPYQVKDEEFFLQVVRLSFASRRKTLINNLNNGLKLPKEKLEDILDKLEIRKDVRAEALDISDFIKLADILKDGEADA